MEDWWKDIVAVCSLEGTFTQPGSATWLTLSSVRGRVGGVIAMSSVRGIVDGVIAMSSVRGIVGGVIAMSSVRGIVDGVIAVSSVRGIVGGVIAMLNQVSLNTTKVTQQQCCVSFGVTCQ